MPTSAPACSFCAIVRHNDRDVREVYRDPLVVAFLPIEPATLGHTLLIPRKHVSKIWDVDDELAAHIARAITRLSAAVKRSVDAEGLNVIQSNGTAASQTVDHLHIHLVPRWEDDAIGRIWPAESAYEAAVEIDAVWQRLRAECRSVMFNA